MIFYLNVFITSYELKKNGFGALRLLAGLRSHRPWDNQGNWRTKSSKIRQQNWIPSPLKIFPSSWTLKTASERHSGMLDQMKTWSWLEKAPKEPSNRPSQNPFIFHNNLNLNEKQCPNCDIFQEIETIAEIPETPEFICHLRQILSMHHFQMINMGYHLLHLQIYERVKSTESVSQIDATQFQSPHFT